jgi:alanine racemase
MSNAPLVRAWVEVRLDALRANLEAVRRAVGPGPAVIAMVKADGYGLGAGRVVRALEPLEPWGYGVATADEGVALREIGVRRPILVCSPLPPGAAAMAAEADLIATVSDIEALESWVAAGGGRGVEFHVEVDTGMGRSGFDWRESTSWAGRVREVAGGRARWAGAYTHFHSADASDATPTMTQWQRFQDALAQFPVSREDLMVHAANSAAAIRWPELAGDAVRPGVFLYGGRAVGAGVTARVTPRGVASVRARIVRIREAPPGSTVGYGATHRAVGWERWATLSIGYGDGLPRTLGNVGEAIVRGRRVRIIGRISMDMTVVDITSVADAVTGDVATLLGRDRDEEITVDEVAERAGTISYEILTRLTSRLPRVER